MLDWVDMEDKGFSHLPLVKPLLSSHLHLTQSTMTSAGPALPSKADCFQSSLTEKGYKAVVILVKALNVSSLLLAYQAELEDNMSTSPTPALWDELCVVTDLCLHLHRCAVQASGRAVALMVAQERARWLNLSSLSQKEKTQLLDIHVDPKGLFGPTVATRQKRCEEKKREGEALQLCLPRKAPPPPPTAPWQTFAQAMARPPYRIPKHQPEDVLFLLKRACSRPYKRRAEAMSALTVHDHAKRRKVRSAESSVEPQRSHKSTHQCPNTHQHPSPPVKSLINIFCGAHPGPEPRAQPHLLMKKMTIREEQTVAVPPHMAPQGVAITPPVVQQASQSAVAGIMSTVAAQPTVPVQPGTAARPPLGPLAFQACLALFRRGATLKFRMCLMLLGLMASALVVVPFGRLHMRPFQRWVASLKLNPMHHGHHQVLVSTACVLALCPWRCTVCLSTGIAMGTVPARKVITTDASLAG